MLNDKFKRNRCVCVVFSFVVLLLVCCKGRENVRLVEEFPSEYDLQATGIDSLNRYPGTYAISMAGDKFIGMRKADHFFFVLDNDFSFISEISAKGHGNGEFMAPLYCGQYVEESGKEYVYILERPKRKLYKVALDESEENKCVFEVPVSWNIEPSFLFLHGKDSCLGVNNMYSCNFFVADLSQDKAEEQDAVYEFSGTEEDVFNVAQSTASYSAGNSRVAMAYFNLPEIDIRASDGRLVQSVFYESVMKPSEINKYAPRMFFDYVTSTSRHIYALYIGDKEEQDAGKSLILVFDWEGNPVCRLRIDASVCFAIDTKNHRIVSINEDDSRFVASEYRLPDILQ